MDESIITNIFITGGINTFLNVANDIDASVMSCSNPCVAKPVSVNTAIRVSSEYC